MISQFRPNLSAIEIVPRVVWLEFNGPVQVAFGVDKVVLQQVGATPVGVGKGVVRLDLDGAIQRFPGPFRIIRR